MSVEDLIRAVPRIRSRYEDLLTWWPAEPEPPSLGAVLIHVVAPELMDAARDARRDDARAIVEWLDDLMRTGSELAKDEVWDVIVWQLEEKLSDDEYAMIFDAAGPHLLSLLTRRPPHHPPA